MLVHRLTTSPLPSSPDQWPLSHQKTWVHTIQRPVLRWQSLGLDAAIFAPLITTLVWNYVEMYMPSRRAWMGSMWTIRHPGLIRSHNPSHSAWRRGGWPSGLRASLRSLLSQGSREALFSSEWARRHIMGLCDPHSLPREPAKTSLPYIRPTCGGNTAYQAPLKGAINRQRSRAPFPSRPRSPCDPDRDLGSHGCLPIGPSERSLATG